MQSLNRSHLSVFILCASSCFGHAQQQDRLLIAAASDLKFALDSIVVAFKANHTSINIETTYGSSGKIFEQISNAAPFDLFFSADIDYPKKLKEQGKVLSEVYSYGKGRIVIWSKKVDPNDEKMNCLLNGQVKKIAIANPAHAPYGKRAVEALKYNKLFDKISDKLVYGENISQAAQFVTTGAADVGIIALSLALSPQMRDGHYYVIRETDHQPLEQGFVILNHAKANKPAAAFRDFVLSAKSKQILSYFGFAEVK